MSPWRLMLCLTLLLPGLGFAQSPDEWTPYTPPAAELPPSPPLIPAPPLPQPAPPEPPAAPAEEPPAEEPPAREIIPRDLSARRDSPGQTVLRLIITPWSGAITGMMGAIVGAVPTAIIAIPFCVGTDGFDDEPRCAIAAGAGLSVSYALGVTLGVAFVGKIMGGKGDGVMTFLGALAGVAVGSGIGVSSQSVGGLILGLAIGPLIGAVTGYELSHTLLTEPEGSKSQARSGFQVMPMAGATPGGGLLAGLAGRF